MTKITLMNSRETINYLNDRQSIHYVIKFTAQEARHYFSLLFATFLATHKLRDLENIVVDESKSWSLRRFCCSAEKPENQGQTSGLSKSTEK